METLFPLSSIGEYEFFFFFIFTFTYFKDEKLIYLLNTKNVLQSSSLCVCLCVFCNVAVCKSVLFNIKTVCWCVAIKFPSDF